ncbi:MAG: hypothetical protein AAF961_06185, partial [Planctomycetota bacterium]
VTPGESTGVTTAYAAAATSQGRRGELIDAAIVMELSERLPVGLPSEPSPTGPAVQIGGPVRVDYAPTQRAPIVESTRADANETSQVDVDPREDSTSSEAMESAIDELFAALA